jgi:hypothetical protein
MRFIFVTSTPGLPGFSPDHHIYAYEFRDAPRLGKTPFWFMRHVAVKYLADLAYAAVVIQMV